MKAIKFTPLLLQVTMLYHPTQMAVQFLFECGRTHHLSWQLVPLLYCSVHPASGLSQLELISSCPTLWHQQEESLTFLFVTAFELRKHGDAATALLWITGKSLASRCKKDYAGKAESRGGASGGAIKFHFPLRAFCNGKSKLCGLLSSVLLQGTLTSEEKAVALRTELFSGSCRLKLAKKWTKHLFPSVRTWLMGQGVGRPLESKSQKLDEFQSMNAEAHQTDEEESTENALENLNQQLKAIFGKADLRNEAVGLYNIGLSCCLNSLLQVFFMNRHFTMILRRIQVPFDPEEKKLSVPYQMLLLLEQMQRGKQKSVHPLDLVKCLVKHNMKCKEQLEGDDLWRDCVSPPPHDLGMEKGSSDEQWQNLAGCVHWVTKCAEYLLVCMVHMHSLLMKNFFTQCIGSWGQWLCHCVDGMLDHVDCWSDPAWLFLCPSLLETGKKTVMERH
ncbi:Ubl carboxyl-terminal hydrolase 18 [Varanus komodoensis]|nr:Ubl carboxyl-terminal hydrolase 18 [Varanus komodoensis]